MKIKKGLDAIGLMRTLRRGVDKQLDGKDFEAQRRILDKHVPLRNDQSMPRKTNEGRQTDQ